VCPVPARSKPEQRSCGSRQSDLCWMDQPDAAETVAAGASILVCRGPRRLQAATADTIVSCRVHGNLSQPDYRVSAGGSCPAPFVVNVHLRASWPGKRESRWTDRAIHFNLVLHHRWNVGRI